MMFCVLVNNNTADYTSRTTNNRTSRCMTAREGAHSGAGACTYRAAAQHSLLGGGHPGASGNQTHHQEYGYCFCD